MLETRRCRGCSTGVGFNWSLTGVGWHHSGARNSCHTQAKSAQRWATRSWIPSRNHNRKCSVSCQEQCHGVHPRSANIWLGSETRRGRVPVVDLVYGAFSAQASKRKELSKRARKKSLGALGVGLGSVVSRQVWAAGATAAAVPLDAVRNSSLIVHDLLVAIMALIGSYAWLKVWDWLATHDYIESTLSRKIVHITSVPLFMLTWPFFSDNHIAIGSQQSQISLQSWSALLGLAVKSSQGIAAAVPAILSARLILAGIGLSQDTLVNALARQKAAMRKWLKEERMNRDQMASSFAGDGATLIRGDRREALQGPLYYCLATTVCTFLFWRGPSPLGILALIQMCVGDGMADLIGRRWQTPKWPLPGEPSRKTLGGTLAYISSAFLISCLYVAIFHACGCVDVGVAAAAGRIAVLTVCCAAVELLAPGDDNITVPLAACLIGSALFPT